jgi:uncharacterized protein (TIGR02680 family)
MGDPSRFRLSRGGVVNVWQYDRQVFDFADGRLLLRGANGAGKSKTMEMLLPFAIDGDKARLTASGRHHTSLLWLLLDGYEGQARTGYVWVEFTRVGDDGKPETLTCGVGLRATQSARAATAWFFTTPLRVGEGLELEGESGPLSRAALEAEVTVDGRGHVFESAARYREHVGQTLFGLASDQYDDLLRLIYWLRQPQVGEDIDPKRLAEQLVNALPQVDDTALRAAGDTFDELEAYGEEIERRSRAASALSGFVNTYAGYARAVVADRAARVIDATGQVKQMGSQLRAAGRESAEVVQGLAAARSALSEAEQAATAARNEIVALEAGPEARSRQRLLEMGKRVAERSAAAKAAVSRREAAARRAERSANSAVAEAAGVARGAAEVSGGTTNLLGALAVAGVGVDSSIHALMSPLTDCGEQLGWAQADGVASVETALDRMLEWFGVTSTAVGQRQAAVRVVREAWRAAEDARREASRLAEAEEAAQARRAAAKDCLDEAMALRASVEEDLLRELDEWRHSLVAVVGTDVVGAGGTAGTVGSSGGDHGAFEFPVFELPVLDLDGLARMETLARAAVAGPVETLSLARGRAVTRQDEARTRCANLEHERTEVESRVDPEPAPPSLVRDRTGAEPGAAFWRLVDFQPGVAQRDRAGLEAALEGAGLLDAWMTADGVVDSARLDVQLFAAWEEGALEDAPRSADSSTLAAVLRPEDGLDALGMSAAVVERVLGRVPLIRADEPPRRGNGLAIGVDGQWRSGPLHGRTTKDVPQYIGATARAGERQRRLASLDLELAETRAIAHAAQSEADVAAAALRGIEDWLGARPSDRAVVQAWSAVTHREEVLGRADAEELEASRRAREARALAATRHTDAVTLSGTHDLPETREGLEAITERLEQAIRDVDGRRRDARAVRADLERWRRVATMARDDAAAAAAEAEAATAAVNEAAELSSEHRALVDAEGASVRELENRIETARSTERRGTARSLELRSECEALIGRQARLEEREASLRSRLAEAEPALEKARAGLAVLDGLPGVVAAASLPEGAALARDGDGERGVAGEGDELVLAALETPRLRELAGRWSTGADLEARTNVVLQAVSGLQAGDAAAHEPRVADHDGVFVALGRDEAGDHSIAELARRLTAAVTRDRELLSERERKVFEDHVLGQLGDALRNVRMRADELVQSMNEQLRDVTTSQGIKVRLRWKQRDDIPPEAGRTLTLLASPLGALLPGEKAELQESLHRLISVSRAEAPEEPYAVHLARALDYRQWNRFSVQYHRPETGEWRNLERRTALSQGEQKVLCYLPLFAAAAAHFTSVAGAAPHAPRFVLLDDAFPKIDVRTHPLLFGLLVDLDLDFVITSERLWGTHVTVPQLAIYEALRSPGDRGIAQYQHRWDGRQLTAVGA